MADTKISNMTAATALDGTELVAGVQSAANVKITTAQVKTLTSASPTLVTPVLGVATATSINKVALTAPATSATITIADGKTLTASNTITLAAGADSQTFTFPASSDTVAVLGTAQTFSASQTYSKAGAASVSANTFTGTPFAGTGTTSFPLIYANGGTGPTTFNIGGAYFGVNAVSGFAGNFLDFHVNGGASVFNVGAGGAVGSATITSTGSVIAGASQQFSWNGRGVMTSPGAGSVQLGAADAASPVAQTLRASSVVAGTGNVAGSNWIIQGSIGTGSGAGGDILMKVAPAGTAGTSQNALVTALTISNTGVPKLPSFIVSGLPSASSAGAGAVAYVTDANAPTFLGNVTGSGSTATPVFSDGTSWRAG